MNGVQQRAAAKHFADYWKGKGYEKGESQKFWLSLLTDVFGVEHAAECIFFEDQVHLDHTNFIDGSIPETHVLIEQKGIDKDLKKPILATAYPPVSRQPCRVASDVVFTYLENPYSFAMCGKKLQFVPLLYDRSPHATALSARSGGVTLLSISVATISAIAVGPQAEDFIV